MITKREAMLIRSQVVDLLKRYKNHQIRFHILQNMIVSFVRLKWEGWENKRNFYKTNNKSQDQDLTNWKTQSANQKHSSSPNKPVNGTQTITPGQAPIK